MFSSIVSAFKKGWSYVSYAASFVSDTIKSGIDAVVGVVQKGYEIACEQTAKVGISLPTVAAYAGAGVAVAGTVALFVTGLPAVVVPIIGVGLVAWLGRDLYSFLTGYKTAAAQAEAALRVSVVVFTGTVVLASMLTHPASAALIVACVAASLMYKVVCSEAGRYHIEQRHEPLGEEAEEEPTAPVAVPCAPPAIVTSPAPTA